MKHTAYDNNNNNNISLFRCCSFPSAMRSASYLPQQQQRHQTFSIGLILLISYWKLSLVHEKVVQIERTKILFPAFVFSNFMLLVY